ncbi:MAG: hypothetical protein M1493_12345 [Firmicutes bacterium]|nr:hypothetical protein [Bacillota bacterium]
MTLAQSVEWIGTHASESGIVPSREVVMPYPTPTLQTMVGMVIMTLWRCRKSNPLAPLAISPTECSLKTENASNQPWGSTPNGGVCQRNSWLG